MLDLVELLTVALGEALGSAFPKVPAYKIALTYLECPYNTSNTD